MTYVYLLIVLNVLGMTCRVNWQHVFLNIFLGCNLSGVNIALSRHGPALLGLATATGCRRDEFISVTRAPRLPGGTVKAPPINVG